MPTASRDGRSKFNLISAQLLLLLLSPTDELLLLLLFPSFHPVGRFRGRVLSFLLNEAGRLCVRTFTYLPPYIVHSPLLSTRTTLVYTDLQLFFGEGEEGEDKEEKEEADPGHPIGIKNFRTPCMDFLGEEGGGSRTPYV